MGAVDKVLAFIAPNTAKRVEKRSRVEPVSQLDLAHYLGGGITWSDIDVDRLTILGLPIVWACIKVLSEALASFPLILYEGTAEGRTRRRAEGHPLYDLLHDQPNPQQDVFKWKEQGQGHLGIYGNYYANIIRNGTGYIQELRPLNPERCFAFRVNGELLYRYRASPYFQTQDLFFRWLQTQNRRYNALEIKRLYDEWLESRANPMASGGDNPIPGYFQTTKAYASYPDQVEAIIPASEVFHVSGFGFDDIRGYSPLELQRQTFGLGIAAKHYAADFFKNGGLPDLALNHEHHLSDAAMTRLRDSWRENHSKWGKKHSPLILEEGMKAQQLSPDPEKVQLVETSKFLVTEICRVYRVPPHMVQDLERATFSNIEHQAIEFVQHTMRPWVMRWEAAISRQLLSDKDRKNLYPEFNMDAILRGDVKTRSEVYQLQIGSGILSPNEARRREQWDDYEGGDERYVPLNWRPVSRPWEPPQKNAPQPGGTPQEQKALAPAETRMRRSAKARHATSESFGILLKDSTARIVRKECHDLRKGCTEKLKMRSAEDFSQWMDRYYRELPDYIRKQITPVFQAFSNAIRVEIASELDIDDAIRTEDEQFVKDFVDVFIQRYIGKSQGTMGQLMKEANPADLADEIMAQMDDWEAKRADQIALNEKVQGSNAFAKNIYRLAGIITLTWVAMGDACPYCAHMNGMSTNIHDDFAYDGEEIPGERSLGMNKNIGHPPLHRGCQCQIMAGGMGRMAPTERDVGAELIEAQVRTISERTDKALELIASNKPEPAHVTVHSAPVSVTIEGNGKVKKRMIIHRDENGDIATLEQTEEKVADGE